MPADFGLLFCPIPRDTLSVWSHLLSVIVDNLQIVRGEMHSTVLAFVVFFCFSVGFSGRLGGTIEQNNWIQYALTLNIFGHSKCADYDNFIWNALKNFNWFAFKNFNWIVFILKNLIFYSLCRVQISIQQLPFSF